MSPFWNSVTAFLSNPWVTLFLGFLSGVVGSIYYTMRWHDWADQKRRARAARLKIRDLETTLGLDAEDHFHEASLTSLEQLESRALALEKRHRFRLIREALPYADAQARDHSQIVGLDHAGLHYNVDDLFFSRSPLQLFVACSPSLQKQILDLHPHYPLPPNRSFDGSATFLDIATITAIPGLPSLLTRHADLVATRVLESLAETRPIFNNGKFGVAAIQFDRQGQHERPTLRLTTFETDYFTHLVFRSVYRELRESGHPIGNTGEQQLTRYRPFLTSFGVNTFVVLDHGGVRSLLFSQRSQLVANPQASLKWHVTMNEGLSLTDYDHDRQCASVFKCLERGLWEELGLSRGAYQNICFYDVFLESTRLELAVTSTVLLPMTFQSFQESASKAPDRHFETILFHQIEYSEHAIASFLSQHQGMLTGAGAYTARILAARACPS